MDLHYQVLCCQCGVSITPNPSNMCEMCLKRNVDITVGVDKEQTILFCKQCEKYSLNGDKYIPAELESPQLLGLCLKKIRGLKNIKILEAKFIWTEPHSRRIRVNLLLQKEVLNGTIVQQEHEVLFIVNSTMCDVCQYSYTAHTWSWCVQLRQKSYHKRTFLTLEQLIIQYRKNFNFYDIKQQSGGLDFFFTQKAQCLRFVDFLHSKVPGKHVQSSKLVSADVKSNTAYRKYTIYFEIASVSRDDLVIVPRKLWQFTGQVNKLAIVYKINQRIHLVDPMTGDTAALTAPQYFMAPFDPIRSRKQRIQGQIVCLDDGGAYVQTENDMENGENNFVYTHLLNQLQDDQKVWLYNAQNIDFEELDLPKSFSCAQKYFIIGQVKEKKDKHKNRRNKRQTRKKQQASDESLKEEAEIKILDNDSSDTYTMDDDVEEQSSVDASIDNKETFELQEKISDIEEDSEGSGYCPQ